MWVLMLNIIGACPDDPVMKMMPMELERNFFLWCSNNHESLMRVLDLDDF